MPRTPDGAAHKSAEKPCSKGKGFEQEPMKEPEPNLTRQARRRGRIRLVIAVAALHASFVGGWATSTLLHEDRVRDEGRRLFGQFLVAADAWGVINRDRLDLLTAGVADEDDGGQR